MSPAEARRAYLEHIQDMELNEIVIEIDAMINLLRSIVEERGVEIKFKKSKK